MPLERFVDAWSALLRALPDGLVRDAKIVRLDSRRPPWTATELQLRRGDEMSWFGETALPSLRVSPTLQVWARVARQAPIFRGVCDSHSFVAAHDGPLELATTFPANGPIATAARGCRPRTSSPPRSRTSSTASSAP